MNNRFLEINGVYDPPKPRPKPKLSNHFLEINGAYTPPPPPPPPPAPKPAPTLSARFYEINGAPSPARETAQTAALTQTLSGLSTSVGDTRPPAWSPFSAFGRTGGFDPSRPVSVFNMPPPTLYGPFLPAQFRQPQVAPEPPRLSTPEDVVSAVADPSNAEFDALVDLGSISQNGRETHYFNTHQEPGDGIIVTEFVIQADVSGFFLKGDGRAITDDPLGRLPGTPDHTLEDSRMLLVIDRETGRGAITVTSSHALFPVDVNITGPHQGSGGPISFPFDVNVDNEVGARPIVIGSGNGTNYWPEDFHHRNYFEITADSDSIRVDYDAVNSVTSPTGTISVDGPIVLERQSDGTFSTGAGHSPDQYPSISTVQYTPDGDQNVIFQQTEKNVFEGASPAPIAEIFEAGREITEEPIELATEVGAEFAEGWTEVGEASWYRKPDQVLEAGGEIVYQLGEGALESAIDVPWELAEGGAEIFGQSAKSLWNTIF